MIVIPPALRSMLEKKLQEKNIARNVQPRYLKWLRYYLDFCSKYGHPPENSASLVSFTYKLHEKRQTQLQQQEAALAIRLYYDVQGNVSVRYSVQKQNVVSTPPSFSAKITHPLPQQRSANPSQNLSSPKQPATALQMERRYSAEDDVMQVKEPPPIDLQKNGKGASWKREYKRLEDEIRLRHYSDKTLRAYRVWMQKFQAYTRSKEPDLLSSDDVKSF